MNIRETNLNHIPFEDRKHITIYLSGKMSGLVDHGFTLFNRAAKALRDKGFKVKNPAENPTDPNDNSWEYFMKMDVKSVVDSDCVVVLHNWEDSRGACIEVNLATELKIPIYSYPDLSLTKLPKPNTISGYPLDGDFKECWTKTEPTPVQFKFVDKVEDILLPPPAYGESILQEADRLVSFDRNQQYGHPKEDFERTAALWSVVVGKKITAYQAILMMALLKISRLCYKYKRDSVTDLGGYAKCLSMVAQDET